MCYACWEEDGKPCIVNNNTLTAAIFIHRVYDRGPSGGHLHAQLEDWNLDSNNFGNLSPEANRDEVECFNYMKKLSFNERVSALAIFEEFIDLNTQKEK